MDRERILEKLRERIVAFAASRLGRDMADDLAQETLALIHAKYAHVEALEELVPLALRIVRLKMTATTRKAHRRGEDTAVSVDEVPIAADAPDPEQQAERHELLERLRRALPTLGARCRELMRLKLAGHSFAEIQTLMKAGAINTVYTWDHRCRQELLDRMGGSWVRRTGKEGGSHDAG